jgi:hypothetical protein
VYINDEGNLGCVTLGQWIIRKVDLEATNRFYRAVYPTGVPVLPSVTVANLAQRLLVHKADSHAPQWRPHMIDFAAFCKTGHYDAH